MKHFIEKICEFCHNPFFVEKRGISKARFCSKSCATSSRTGKKSSAWKGGTNKKCKVCQNYFYAHPSSKKEYCSRKCFNSVYKGKNTVCWKGGKKGIKCPACEKVFYVDPSNHRRKFCSKKCMDTFKVGENSHMWMGGLSFYPYPPTFNEQFKNMVRNRDSFTCAICNGYGKSVHHIDYVKENTSIENCVTLCAKCHAKTNHRREYWVSFFLVTSD